MDKHELIVNLSRIDKSGSGLYVFSMNFLDIVRKKFSNTQIKLLAQKNLIVDREKLTGVSITTVPRWISITKKISFVRPILWYLYALLSSVKLKNKVLCTTHHAIPKIRNQIVTVHDLRPFFYPDSWLQGIYFRHILPRTIKNIDGIITVSEYTKKLITKYYQISPDRIYVVPNAVDTSCFYPCINKNKFNPYLLMVGATWQHKNAHEVISRYKHWLNKYRLKIVSGNGQYNNYLRTLVHKYGLEKAVDFIGYTSRSDLISLYQNASALIYPSKMEGFGIPPLEAMACGTPVIASNIDVFNELFEDVPIYIDLEDEQSWRDAFVKLQDESLLEIKGEKGFQKCSQYSLQRMNDALVYAIHEIWPDLKDKGNFLLR